MAICSLFSGSDRRDFISNGKLVHLFWSQVSLTSKKVFWQKKSSCLSDNKVEKNSCHIYFSYFFKWIFKDPKIGLLHVQEKKGEWSRLPNDIILGTNSTLFISFCEKQSNYNLGKNYDIIMPRECQQRLQWYSFLRRWLTLHTNLHLEENHPEANICMRK